MQLGVIDPHSQGHPDMWRLSRIPEPDSFQHIALLWCQLSVSQVIEVKPPSEPDKPEDTDVGI